MQHPPDDRIIAARIGPGNEPTSIVLLQRVEQLTEDFDRKAMRWRTTVRLEVPLIVRLPGGSSQNEIADVIGDLVAEAKAERADRVTVVADITTPGVPFLELAQRRGIRALPCMTADAPMTRADRLWYLPARELISVTLMAMIDRRLELAPGEHAETAVAQLEAYRTRGLPKDSLSDWRPAPHTDLAGSLMTATW